MAVSGAGRRHGRGLGMMIGRRVAFRLLAGAGAIAFALGMRTPASAQSWNMYDGYTTSTFLRFLNPAGNISAPPTLSLQFGAGPLSNVTMDTGSTGIVVSQDLIPNFA